MATGEHANIGKAVNELDGRIFNGNAIAPRFYDADKFEKGMYTGKQG